MPWHLIALLLLTVLAGVTRFVALDKPGIWVDESSTFRRTTGSYDDMLSSLQGDFFGPLWYSSIWVLRQFYTPDPFHIRLIPAIASLLFVPAMYFLARQLASIRTALVTTLLTVCSAFMINYGRDAKMYMLFWLFVALSAGTFLWWVRTRTWTAWLSWIAASCAMMGINCWGGLVLAMAPLWMLTGRKVHWAMGLGLIVGLAVIAVGPVGYYTQFSRAVERTSERGHFIGINWLQDRNRDATALDLIKDTTSAYFFKFTFIQEADSPHVDPPKRVLSGAVVTLTAMLTLLAIGLLPWRRFNDPLPASAPEPWWRPTLWLTTWIVVPTYLFYCISIRRPISPSEWVWSVHEFIGFHWLAFTLLIVIGGAVIGFFPRVQKWTLIAVVAVALGLLGYACISPTAGEPIRSIAVVDAWLTQLTSRSVLWPMMVLIPAIAIARSGSTFFQRGFHLLIAVLIGVGMYFVLDLMHDACVNATTEMRRNGVSPSSIWIPRYLGFIWPAVAIAMAALLVRLPTWPLRYTAIAAVCAVNLYVAWNRVMEPTEPPLGRIVADIYAAAEPKSNVRTFVQPANVHGGPGAAVLMNGVGPYYGYTYRKGIAVDRDSADHWDNSLLPLPNLTAAPNMIGYTAKNAPQVDRIIAWKPFYPTPQTAQDEDIAPPDPAEPDAILKNLGPSWKLEREELLPVRYHWSWGEMYLYRRREYVKSAVLKSEPGSTTRPAK